MMRTSTTGIERPASLADRDDVDAPGPQPVSPPRRTLLTSDGKLVRQPLIEDPELQAMRAADEARDAAFHPLNEVGKHRLRIYVLGGCVAFPLANFLLTPAGFQGLWFQLLVGAAYGAFVALVRPGALLCALTTVLAGVAVQAQSGVTGGAKANFYILLAMILYGTAGYLIGSRENDKQLDR